MNVIACKRVRRTLLVGSLAFATGAIAQSTTNLPDAQIESNVLRALASAPNLSTQNIQSSTVYGTVTLTGNVHDEALRTQAENLVARAAGVKKVVDEMTLGDTPATSDQANAEPTPDQQAAPGQQPPQDGQLQSDGTYAPAPQDQDEANGAPPPQDQGAPQANPQDNGQYPGGYGPPQQNPQQYPQDNSQANPPNNGQYPGGYGPPQQNPQDNSQANPPSNGQQYPGGYGPPQGQSPDQGQPYPGQPQGQPPYPNQGQPYGPPSGPPPRQPLYQNGQTNYPPQNYAPPGGQQAGLEVTVPAGALLRIRINRGLDSNHIKPGTPFDGTVLSDVAGGGAIAIPRGASVQGVVVDAKKSGVLKGRGELGLQINSVTLAGNVYPINTDLWQRNSRDKTAGTVNSALGFGALGAILGGIAGGGAGAAIGAGVGGAAGVAGSAASPGGRVIIPPEAVLNFHLAQPAVVKTVSEQEMSRLAYAAGNAQPQQPQMRRYYNPNYGYYYAPY